MLHGTIACEKVTANKQKKSLKVRRSYTFFIPFQQKTLTPNNNFKVNSYIGNFELKIIDNSSIILNLSEKLSYNIIELVFFLVAVICKDKNKILVDGNSVNKPQ